MRVGRFIVVALALFASTATDAQQPVQNSDDGKVGVTLTVDSAGTGTLKLTRGAPTMTAQQLAIFISWDSAAKVDTTKLQLRVGAMIIPRAFSRDQGGNAARVQFKWEADATPTAPKTVIAVWYGDSTAKLSLSWEPKPGAATTAVDCRVWAEKATDLARKANEDLGRWFLSVRAVKNAHLVLDVSGRVLVSPREGIREDQQLSVSIVGTDGNAAARRYVERTSAIRQIDAMALAGTAPATIQTERRGAGTPAEGDCTRHQVLSFFAPGEGKLALYSLGDDNKAVKVAEYALPVRRTVHGQVSAGVLWSKVLDPKYQLIQLDTTYNAKDTTLTALRDGADSSKRLVPMVFLTAFLPSPHDLDGPNAYRDLGWWVAPTVGFNPQRIGDDWFLGATMHLSRIVMINYGWHFSKGQTLRNQAENIKAPYRGDPGALPVRTTTRTGRVWGVGVDGVAAATWLGDTVKNLFGSWGSSGKQKATEQPKDGGQ